MPVYMLKISSMKMQKIKQEPLNTIYIQATRGIGL